MVTSPLLSILRKTLGSKKDVGSGLAVGAGVDVGFGVAEVDAVGEAGFKVGVAGSTLRVGELTGSCVGIVEIGTLVDVDAGSAVAVAALIAEGVGEGGVVQPGTKMPMTRPAPATAEYLRKSRLLT